MSEHAPRAASEKEKESNALEFRQSRIALERLGDGACTLRADVVVIEAVYAFAAEREAGEMRKENCNGG